MKRKSKQEIEADEVISSAFQQFIRLFSEIDISEERSKEINDSILADLLGDPPLPNTKLVISKSVVELMHRFLELQQTTLRFPAISKMIHRHPWGSYVAKSQHLENCYHLLCNECYILEERLKRFIEATNSCALEFGFAPLSKAAVSSLLQAHKKSLGTYVAMRGQHVHQRSLIPREIGRISLIETLMNTDYLKDHLPTLHRMALTDARRIWRNNSESMSTISRMLIARALLMTEHVWKPSIDMTTIPPVLGRSADRRS